MSNNSSPVRVRFAPSPTGDLHVGGARTALFNYLFAKANRGSYVLRIEDTDLQRSTPEAVQAIFDGLNWLRLNSEQEPVYQTQRFDLYKKYAKELLKTGHAYRCYCTSEELQKMREEQMARKENPMYNRLHRPQDDSPQSEILPDEATNSGEPAFVIRLKAPLSGTTSYHDQILGEIHTPNEELDDFVIVRSDGSPTYNLTVVVDDHEMGITHVIRGMDHVSNTPKQLAIYQALGLEPPQFAHVPMILGSDKKKLSKRHGATSVVDYRLDGYLPDAFINYIARLGWSCQDREIFSRQDLIESFSLSGIGKSPAVFDTEKLLWVNSEHIKTATPQTLIPLVLEFLETLTKSPLRIPFEQLPDHPGFAMLIESLQPRSRTLTEMASSCLWFVRKADDIDYEESLVSKHFKPNISEAYRLLVKKLSSLNQFVEPDIEQVFTEVIQHCDVKLGKLAQPVRIALTGTAVSPPIYLVCEALGKEESLKRLTRGLEWCI